MPKADKPKSLRDLYPGLTEEQLEEAEKTLDEYLELVLRIYTRIKDDPVSLAKLEKTLAEEKRKKKPRKKSR